MSCRRVSLPDSGRVRSFFRHGGTGTGVTSNHDKEAHQGSAFCSLIWALQNEWLFLRASARTLLNSIFIVFESLCSFIDTKNYCGSLHRSFNYNCLLYWSSELEGLQFMYDILCVICTSLFFGLISAILHSLSVCSTVLELGFTWSDFQSCRLWSLSKMVKIIYFISPFLEKHLGHRIKVSWEVTVTRSPAWAPERASGNIWDTSER
jgi:hypothetical protein